MPKRKLIIIALAGAAVCALAFAALWSGLTVSRYTIETGKLEHSVRFVLLADLHSGFHGEGQRELLDEIAEQSPDLVFLVGDIADDKIPFGGTIALLEGLQGKYDCYYVTGNHEIWSGESASIKELFREYGVTVLDGERAEVAVRGQRINICGVDDPDIGSAEHNAQLERTFAAADADVFTILLSHRPERFEQMDYPFDLMLSGHAHGGQWRIPLLLPGLYSPNQGLFPKYTSGVYEHGGRKMLVSRGLSRESTRVPRIFNAPELVVVDLVPG